MNGNRNIIDIIDTVVSKMTPFVTVSSIEASGDYWRLNTCNTFWITIGSEIIIDSVSYTVENLSQNAYIEISASAEPTVTEFQLSAPEFWHSASRKVSNERSQKTDVRKPFVYLPIPNVVEDNTIGSDLAYNAEIRPIFLTNFNPQKDTIELQQTEIIEPLNAMADFFIYLIKEDTANFDDFDSVDRREWMNFGEQTVWGNDKKIFKENLSGVELSGFTLPVLINDSCDCSLVTKICADAIVTINDEFYAYVGSGSTINIETGTCEDATVTVNGDEFDTVDSGGTLPITVEYYTSEDNPIESIIGRKIIIIDPIVIPTNKIYLRPEPTGEIYISGSSFYPTGCDSWMIANGIDISTQPSSGVPMLIDKTKRWKLIPDNVFGHKFRFTGLTGGYYNPETLNYYNSDGTTAIYNEAFPSNYMIDNSTGLGWQTVANATNVAWATALSEIDSLSHAGFDDYYLPDLSKTSSVVDYGYTSPFGSSGDFNPIFAGGITNGNKWTSTTIKGLETRAWVLQPNGDPANNVLKTGIARYMAFRFHFNNS